MHVAYVEGILDEFSMRRALWHPAGYYRRISRVVEICRDFHVSELAKELKAADIREGESRLHTYVLIGRPAYLAGGRLGAQLNKYHRTADRRGVQT